jgi:hypothetical protein
MQIMKILPGLAFSATFLLLLTSIFTLAGAAPDKTQKKVSSTTESDNRTISYSSTLPYKYYFPLISTGIVETRHGFGVRDAGDYDGGILWFNWHHNRCHHASYWPMVYSKSKGSLDVPANCAGKPLLLLNEPEYRGQANTAPERAAEIIHQFRDWQGPLYCCGNYYAQLANGDYYLHPQGINYMWAVIREYERRYNTAPPLTGIHLHIYNLSPTYHATLLVEVETLHLWRQMADRYNWQIVVSEMGAIPHGGGTERIIKTLPGLYNLVEEELRPEFIFWFVYGMPDVHHQNSEDFSWSPLSLYRDDELTEVGQAWYEYTGLDR